WVRHGIGRRPAPAASRAGPVARARRADPDRSHDAVVRRTDAAVLLAGRPPAPAGGHGPGPGRRGAVRRRRLRTRVLRGRCQAVPGPAGRLGVTGPRGDRPRGDRPRAGTRAQATVIDTGGEKPDSSVALPDSWSWNRNR